MSKKYRKDSEVFFYKENKSIKSKSRELIIQKISPFQDGTPRQAQETSEKDVNNEETRPRWYLGRFLNVWRGTSFFYYFPVADIIQ